MKLAATLNSTLALVSIEIAKLLLEAGADVNFASSRDHAGSALTNAVASGSKEMVELLLKAGADVDAVVGAGGRTPLLTKTALSVAVDPEIKQMLMRYKAFKFIKIDRSFDKEPEPQDYENGEVGNGDLEDELDKAEEQIEAFMKDHIAYWHDKVQIAYEPFLFENDSAPLRALLTQELSEKMGLILLTIAHFFNSREDFLYVLNQLKDGATEKELKGLQEIIEAEKKSEEGLVAIEA